MKLKSTVEQVSPTRVRINVEVPFDELKPNFDRAYRKLAKQVNIPGFRKGKVPAKVLESRIGRPVVLDEVLNEAIPAKYSEAAAEAKVRAIGQPNIELTKIEDNDFVEFTAEVDIRPEITLPAFGELKVTVDAIEVADDAVEQQLDDLRKRFGTLTGVERAVAKGDFVVIDLAATVDGNELADAATTGMSYEVGSGGLIDGIDEALIGIAADESKTFTTALVAGEYSGQDAEVTVKVSSIKERILPEADDDFAQLASEFDTIDELKADLVKQVERQGKAQQAITVRDKVLEALLDSTEVPLPESVLEAEVENRKHDAIHSFDHDEDQLTKFVESQGQTREEFDAEIVAEAEKAVKSQLILDKIAEEENIQVSDSEFTDRILYQAQSYGIQPQEYIQRAQESGQLPAIFSDVRRGKALAGVVRNATIVDAAGESVDVAEFFGADVDASPEADVIA
jgi:trigger factor